MNVIVRSIVPRCRIPEGIPVKPPMLPAKQRRTITLMFGVSLYYFLVLCVCCSVHENKFVFAPGLILMLILTLN